MATEIIYEDGSISSFPTDGGGFHAGDTAMLRIRLITASSALEIYLRTKGRMELTKGGANAAIKNVIEPMTGKTYKRSMNGKAEALADALIALQRIEDAAVVYQS